MYCLLSNTDHFFLVVECPYLPLPAGVLRSSDATNYQALITYRCAPGYYSVDYVELWTIECMNTGKWSNDIPHCQGLSSYRISEFALSAKLF